MDNRNQAWNTKRNSIFPSPWNGTVSGYTRLMLAGTKRKGYSALPAMPRLIFKIHDGNHAHQVFDVGIAECSTPLHSVPGMATQGMRGRFCNIYSLWRMQGKDMVVHDVAIQNCPWFMTLAGGRRPVGEDGPTHHGCHGIALHAPHTQHGGAPMNERELRNMTYTAQLEKITNRCPSAYATHGRRW